MRLIRGRNRHAKEDRSYHAKEDRSYHAKEDRSYHDIEFVYSMADVSLTIQIAALFAHVNVI